MDWTKTEDKQPAPGIQVLTWQAGTGSYVISSVDEKGEWEGMSDVPTCWMPLPFPPMEDPATTQATDLKHDIIDNRMSLSMDEHREAIAGFMQYYISGEKVTVSGTEYYVVDMQNEIGGSNVITTFYFRPANE